MKCTTAAWVAYIMHRPTSVDMTACMFLSSYLSAPAGRLSFLGLKLEFHDADTDTDILARILADTSDTRDFLKLLLWQAERHADILATILARKSRVIYRTYKNV